MGNLWYVLVMCMLEKELESGYLKSSLQSPCQISGSTWSRFQDARAPGGRVEEVAFGLIYDVYPSTISRIFEAEVTWGERKLSTGK